MIKIKIHKKNKRITYFEVSGHANFSKYGEDIVCSAISSVVQMTLNGLLETLKLNLVYIEKEGYTMCDLEKSELMDEEYEKANILTYSMFSYLEEIAKIYKKYVKLEVREV